MRSLLQIWSDLLKKSLIENFISLCSARVSTIKHQTKISMTSYDCYFEFIWELFKFENQVKQVLPRFFVKTNH